MGEELEVVGAASVGGLTSGDHHPVEPGKPCGNCGTIVEHRYCPVCGQLGSDFHRPFFSLVASSIADTFAVDSRLWRSIPLLLFRPGRLTRNYLDGKRARYVPPFRMFLLASVLFFLTVFGLGDRMGWYDDWKIGDQAGPVTFQQGEEGRQAAIAEMEERLTAPDITDAEREALTQSIEAMVSVRTSLGSLQGEDGKIDRDELHRAVVEGAEDGTTEAEKAAATALADKVADVFENQDRFGQRLKEWTPRFSLMFMPILALMLTISYAWHRSLFIYDHVIAALHFQTFLYLLLTVLVLIGAFTPAGAGWAALAGCLTVTAYMYRMLRVAYGTGRFMAALRTSILLFLGITVLVLLAIGLVVLSFLLT
ncbi:MAG: DUF3667 domain-containing protein [Hyphomonas sp.]|nr:DUF3667 domain-containing protein [Hyphomonas sp.]